MINLKNTIYCLLFLSFILLNPTASANENTVKLKGYVKTLASLTDFTGLDLDLAVSRGDEPDYEGASINTLRLELFWQPNELITGEFAYEMIPRIQDAERSESFFAIRAANPLSYRAADFGKEMFSASDNSDFRLLQNLDRAFITLSPDFGDIYVGRQPVAFGSARVINPTDVITSFTYIELNNEERVGVDAVRMKVPYGEMGELDIGMVAGDDLSSEESAAFIRARMYAYETDIAPIAVLFKENLLLGIDIARSAGDAGFWFEGGYTFANIADNHISGQDYLRVSTGLDYSFSESLYAYIEYHFNEAGRSDADDYSELLRADNEATAYDEGAVYLFGKHYIAPGFTYQITPLFTFIAGALYNINDNSVLLYPDFRYSLSDEAEIEAGAFVGVGRKGKIVRNAYTGEIDISADSEFGLYPDTYFISAKLFF
jgi:hypothetical protein